MNERECIICHKCFKCYGQLRYCSDKCRITGYRTSRGLPMDNNLITKSCAVCGKEFQTTYPHKRYCSQSCSYEANLASRRKLYKKNKENEPKKVYETSCIVCGAAIKSRSALSIYCSGECRKKRTAQLNHERYLKRKEEPQDDVQPKSRKRVKPEVLDKTAKRAKAKGMSYGQYKAQEYEVKVEFPWRKKK